MSIYTKFEPFVYLIGWSFHNRFYIGSRYGKNSHPSQLWTKYFTSSKSVKSFRIEYGEPDIIEIRKTFNSGEKAHDYEIKLLQRIRAVKDNKFLNLSDSKKLRSNGVAWNKGIPMPEEQKERQSQAMKGKPGPNKGIPRSEEVKEKIRIKRKEQIITDETKMKLSLLNSGENNPMFGKKHSAEALMKMCGHGHTGEDNGMFGKKHSPESKEKMRVAALNMSEETKEKMRISARIAAQNRAPMSEEIKEKLRKPKELVTCPHCQKTGGISVMMRWHFNNCKNVK